MHGMRRNGVILAILGLAGIAFFWLTDPRFGVFGGSSRTAIDRANDSLMGTAVGLAASVLVLVIGLWLGTRRRI